LTRVAKKIHKPESRFHGSSPGLAANMQANNPLETSHMTVITTVEDLRVLAQQRVPRMFYDYADSGSWTESTYRANA